MNRRFDWSPHQVLRQNTVTLFEGNREANALEQYAKRMGIRLVAYYEVDRQLVVTRGPEWFICLLWRSYRTMDVWSMVRALDLLTEHTSLEAYETMWRLHGREGVDDLFVQALAHAVIDHNVKVRLNYQVFLEETTASEQEINPPW